MSLEAQIVSNHSLIHLPYKDNENKEAVDFIINNKQEIKNKWIKKALEFYEIGIYEYYKSYSKVVVSFYNYYHEPLISYTGWVPKIILAQINTHRTLSKNAASSRAISLYKNIRNAIERPYLPVYSKNKVGMSGDCIDDIKLIKELLEYHFEMLYYTITKIVNLNDIHKQNVNRYLEPYVMIPVVITGSYISYHNNINSGWKQFIDLRHSENAQHEIQFIAKIVKDVYEYYKSLIALDLIQEIRLDYNNKIDYNIEDYHAIIKKSKIHIPFKSDFYEKVLSNYELDLEQTSAYELINDKNVLVLAAKIARLSTITYHQGNIEKDIDLGNRLIKERHMSPFEHICFYAPEKNYYNLKDWISLRYIIENKLVS